MFTGLIEEIGIIKNVRSLGKASSIQIEAHKIIDELKIDDSVSINGACQTVVKINGAIFDVVAVEETLRKTTLGSFLSGKKVNLERALRLSDRFGGHFVQGHVDCVGRIETINHETSGKLIWIKFPHEFQKYIVNTGSICLNGVSLTVAKVEHNRFMISIIPHTWEQTTLCDLKSGDEVNLEFDVIGKYIEKLIDNKSDIKTNSSFLDQFINQPD